MYRFVHVQVRYAILVIVYKIISLLGKDVLKLLSNPEDYYFNQSNLIY